MRSIVLRTLAEKADADLWWSRPDEEFFAAGACHVLAGAFLRAYPGAGFRLHGCRPLSPHERGAHFVVAREDVVFDWAGYTPRSTFLADYRARCEQSFPAGLATSWRRIAMSCGHWSEDAAQQGAATDKAAQ